MKRKSTDTKIEVRGTEVTVIGRDNEDCTPAFNTVEFDGIKKQAGLNSYTLTTKWLEGGFA